MVMFPVNPLQITFGEPLRVSFLSTWPNYLLTPYLQRSVG